MPAKMLGAIIAVAMTAAFLAPINEATAASSVSLCIASKKGTAVKSGECPANTKTVTYTSVALPAEPEEQQTLLALLPHIHYAAEGIDGKPTIQFSGINMQIVDGEGSTSAINGAGNLVLGYDENPTNRTQTGSHNLIVGPYQQYTSFGGIITGSFNAIEAEGASVIGGWNNDADGKKAVVAGGEDNVAFGEGAAVSGGSFGAADGRLSSVSGGKENHASGEGTSIVGGANNTAVGAESSIGGGFKNFAEGALSAIFGGKELKTTKIYEAKP
jgi:hypothetical protein